MISARVELGAGRQKACEKSSLHKSASWIRQLSVAGILFFLSFSHGGKKGKNHDFDRIRHFFAMEQARAERVIKEQGATRKGEEKSADEDFLLEPFMAQIMAQISH